MSALHPSAAARWAALNLSGPNNVGALPMGPTVADALIWALVAEEIEDPIEGIIERVRGELIGLADLMGPEADEAAGVLRGLAARLALACTLLATVDGRASGIHLTAEGGPI